MVVGARELRAEGGVPSLSAEDGNIARPGPRNSRGRRTAPAAAGHGAPSTDTIDRLRRVAIPAAIAVLTFLAFLPTFQNGFVDWDDQYNFQLNPSYRGLGADVRHEQYPALRACRWTQDRKLGLTWWAAEQQV